MFGGMRGDPRVKRLLDTLELKYSVDNDGDFKVMVEFEDGRSQAAFINSQTEAFGDFEIRELWSAAYVSEGYLDIDTANTLLMKNFELKIGSWRLIPAGNNTFLVAFCVQIAAECDPNSFWRALAFVLGTADEMEAKLTGADNL
jgi:hypothetical protein